MRPTRYQQLVSDVRCFLREIPDAAGEGDTPLEDLEQIRDELNVVIDEVKEGA